MQYGFSIGTSKIESEMKGLIKKLLLLVLLVTVIIFVTFLILEMVTTKIEKVKLTLEATNETVYLKHMSRGVSLEMNILSEKACTRIRSYTERDYVDSVGDLFFFKVASGRLYIYGGNWENKQGDGIAGVTFINIEGQIAHYKEHYKKYGLSVFPPSYEKYIR